MKIKAFCNTASVWGSLVKLHPLVALITRALSLSIITIVADKGSFSHNQAFKKW